MLIVLAVLAIETTLVAGMRLKLVLAALGAPVPAGLLAWAVAALLSLGLLHFVEPFILCKRGFRKPSRLERERLGLVLKRSVTVPEAVNGGHQPEHSKHYGSRRSSKR